MHTQNWFYASAVAVCLFLKHIWFKSKILNSSCPAIVKEKKHRTKLAKEELWVYVFVPQILVFLHYSLLHYNTTEPTISGEKLSAGTK